MAKTKAVVVIFYKDTGEVWGIFTTHEKAVTALNGYGPIDPLDFYYRHYLLNYRSKAVRLYVSDSNVPSVNTLDDLAIVPVVGRTSPLRSESMVRDNELPNSEKTH